jgi:thiamine transporter ThiT
MKTFGLTLGVLAALGMLLAFIPLLGWLNWINIPFAIIGLIISAIGNSNGGMVLCGIAVIFGLIRLILGGGIL